MGYDARGFQDGSVADHEGLLIPKSNLTQLLVAYVDEFAPVKEIYHHKYTNNIII